MSWGIFQCILYGLMIGLTTFLPISPNAHSALFAELTGAGGEIAVYRFLCDLSCFLVVLISCFPRISRLRRQRRLAAIPMRRRKRQPDAVALLDIRVLRTMIISAVPAAAVALIIGRFLSTTLFLCAFLILCGIILFVCRVRPIGNKDSRSFSAADSILTGIAAGLGCLSGLSPIALGFSISFLSGGGKRYSAENVLMLMIPILIVVLAFDVFAVIGVGVSLGFAQILCYIFAAVFSGIGSVFAIYVVRFLSVKSDFSAFAFYCWGTALFMLCLYLIV